MIKKIDPGLAPSSGPVSDAIQHGHLLWIVAIAEDPQTGKIVQGGIEEQTKQVLENLDRSLKAAGVTRKAVVQVQLFLIDAADSVGMNRVYADFFSPPFPVRATVVVKQLLSEGLRIELTATAVTTDY